MGQAAQGLGFVASSLTKKQLESEFDIQSQMVRFKCVRLKGLDETDQPAEAEEVVEGTDCQLSFARSVVTGGSVVESHFRFACKKYDFSMTRHQSHCAECFCWICDCSVAQCSSWLIHQVIFVHADLAQ